MYEEIKTFLEQQGYYVVENYDSPFYLAYKYKEEDENMMYIDLENWQNDINREFGHYAVEEILYYNREF